MLSNFIFSINAVLPVFIIIFFGYLLRKKNILGEKTISEMNGLVFNFALPLMLFRDVLNSGLSGFFDVGFILWAAVSTILCYAASWIFAEIYLREHRSMVSAFVQGAFRGNYALVGVPLIANILGEGDTGKGALVIAVVVPIYNVLSVIVLSVKKTDGNGDIIKSTVISICKNPLIIGVLSGIIVSGLKIKLPAVAAASINYMAALSTPLALLAIGGTITISASIKKIKPAIVAALIKTAITPLIFVPISIFALGYSGEDLTVLYVMYSTPTAVSSFVMASRMNADDTLASSIIILSTVFSVFTFTLGIYLLKTFSWI